MKKEQLLLYAVTDRLEGQNLCEQVEQAILGGVTCVQLREKNLSEELFLKEAIEIKKICHQYGIPLLINDNLHVALESGADGIHVGQEDCAVSKIREIAGKNFLIGATAKTVEQALQAEKEGADYLGVGAVFPSPTKKNALRITKTQLKEICDAVSIPAVAIGGIGLDNIAELAGSGISGVAVVSSLFSADDVKIAAQNLKHAVSEVVV